MSRRPISLACLGALLTGAVHLGAQDRAVDSSGIEFFEKKVRPVLADNCYACHGPHAGEGQAGLRLDSLRGMLEGGRSGPAIVPGEPARSLMILAVNHDTFVQMPPKSKLELAEIQTLTKWVKMGAPWPNTQPVAQLKETAAAETEDGFTEEEKFHWAFQPVVEPDVPEVQNADWPRSPIDRFILSRLESQGLGPAPEADRRTLIRRAKFDLHGLPPTPEEVAAFLSDASPDAFAKVIDRLLASPRYGERWGRHWLDVARYADSNGMDDNVVYADAWRYRNYVINAFNSDKSYDQFVREQLAGDLLTQWGDPNRAEGLIATTFLTLGPKMVGEDDPVKQKLDFADEQLATTARGMMALSIDCARCHDHKFDPISSQDYYSLLGIFASTQTVLTYRVTSKMNATALGGPVVNDWLTEIEARYDFHDDFLTNTNLATTPKEVMEEHREALEAAKAAYATIPKAMAAGDGEIADLPVMVRGNHLTPGEPAPRSFPAIFSGEDQEAIGPDRSGRLELAEWLTRPEHPLTARVMVNRIWKWHFGEGIVRSTNNFGLLGDPPDHPELLDWLTTRFVEGGWSIKDLHRRILLSSVYQMSTHGDPRAAEIDPDNRLLSRMNRRRMEAEVVRDSLLAVSGQLDETMGGKPLPFRMHDNLNAEGRSRNPALYQATKRSVYLPVLRSALYDVFAAFDFADPSTTNGSRASTTVAPQALFMLNSSLMENGSRALAGKLLEGDGLNDRQRIARAYEIAYSRPPEEADTERWLSFLDRYEKAQDRETDSQERRLAAWQALSRVLLSSNEFVYIE